MPLWGLHVDWTDWKSSQRLPVLQSPDSVPFCPGSQVPPWLCALLSTWAAGSPLEASKADETEIRCGNVPYISLWSQWHEDGTAFNMPRSCWHSEPLLSRLLFTPFMSRLSFVSRNTKLKQTGSSFAASPGWYYAGSGSLNRIHLEYTVSCKCSCLDRCTWTQGLMQLSPGPIKVW